MSNRIAELEAEVSRLKNERDELEAALSKAELYRSAIDSAPFGVMCVFHESGNYVFSNPAHAGFLGYTQQEIVASDPYQRWEQITHPEDFERERNEFKRLAAGEIPSFESERRCVRKDGQVRWARVRVEGRRDAEGRLSYIFVYFMDVHDHHMAIEARERAESQLRQSQKLEALGRLAGGVAHDFNNRLVIIMGYAEILKNGLPPDSHAAQQAETIVVSAKRAAELTRQLLAYSRRQVLKPQAFDLNETVDRMRRLLERLIGDDVELVTVLGAKYPVFSDPGQIEQVILNLAINARDAMPGGGRLTLETRDIVLGESPQATLPPGEYAGLVVSDTGTGIPAEVLPRIFEPFFTTKEVGRGTGLGLSTVEGIVRQSGGAVLVDSRSDSGTTFTVCLPRAEDVPLPASAPLAAPAGPLSFETVLVCDDDDAVRSLLVEVLRLRAYEVLEARTGMQALELARTHDGRIALLITDLVMPDMNGMELATELRKERPETKVLYVSGYTDDEAQLSSSLGPEVHFLAKPFLPGELARAVRAMLTGSPSIEPGEARARA